MNWKRNYNRRCPEEEELDVDVDLDLDLAMKAAICNFYLLSYVSKLRVLETVVFPTALYGCEAWTINNTDAKRITSFEMKCYRKILRISWMEKVTNKEVLSRLDMKTTMLLQKAKTLKLKYFGHIKRHETLERHILEARIDGRRGRGRLTRRWEQDINDWMDMTTTQAGRLAEDRILFRQKVQEATSRQEISWSRRRRRSYVSGRLFYYNNQKHRCVDWISRNIIVQKI